ncbi:MULTISPECIES: hypothetical protein [Mitsuokella]|nr:MULTISPECIES: hypothetical protein [Mitsuokella]MEE0480626.1 hypothetical protein [Mitsuokella jalaludinii]
MISTSRGSASAASSSAAQATFQNPNHMALAIHKIIEFFHED